MYIYTQNNVMVNKTQTLLGFKIGSRLSSWAKLLEKS